MREHWGLTRHQQLSLALEDKLAFTLTEIAALKVPCGAAGEVVQREQNYFATHARCMNYRMIQRRGWPIGSGPVESACRQRQCRFKRSGQFWTLKGMRHPSALTEAGHNHHWDELWPTV